METRIIVCSDCGGDGGLEILGHEYDRSTGAPMTYWSRCKRCGGVGELEIEVEPITIEDLTDA